MPEIKTVHDRDSWILPHIDELRASQKKGNTGSGANDNTSAELNSTQGHGVDIRTDGSSTAS